MDRIGSPSLASCEVSEVKRNHIRISQEDLDDRDGDGVD